MIGFGNSTRADWDTKPKKSNPCAGPGSYKSPSSVGKQAQSATRTLPAISFCQASRNPGSDDTTPSPGPAYNLTSTIGNTAAGSSFGTSSRPELYGKSEGPGPSINLKSSFSGKRTVTNPTFGSEKRLRNAALRKRVPGPIYNLDLRGFKTGPSLGFSCAKRF